MLHKPYLAFVSLVVYLLWTCTVASTTVSALQRVSTIQHFFFFQFQWEILCASICISFVSRYVHSPETQWSLLPLSKLFSLSLYTYKCLLFLNFARQTINGNWLQVRNKVVSEQLKKRWTRHAIGLVQSNLRRIEKLNSHVTCWNCGSLLCMTGHLYLYCMLCEHQVTVTIDLSRVLFIFLDRVFCHFTHLMKKKKKKTI